MERKLISSCIESTEALLNSRNGYRAERVPIPRYTYPVVFGLALSFPKETLREGVCELNYRIGQFAPVAVALNEVADIGVSADLRLERGVRQERVVPLIQLGDYLLNVLSERTDRFTTIFPNLKRMLEIMRTDFLLLSRSRGKLNPRTFLELDSGIIEAGYTAVALPQVLSSAGIDFPGKPCKSIRELLSKYVVYCISSGDNYPSENTAAKKIQRLHAVEMAMKIVDDNEDTGRGSFDRIVGLPNFALWAEQESKNTGQSPSSILKEVKREYISMASEGFFSRMGVIATVLSSHISGIIKDGKGCKGILPTDDLWQLIQLTNRYFTLQSSVLRHQLVKSALIDRAFSK